MERELRRPYRRRFDPATATVQCVYRIYHLASLERWSRPSSPKGAAMHIYISATSANVPDILHVSFPHLLPLLCQRQQYPRSHNGVFDCIHISKGGTNLLWCYWAPLSTMSMYKAVPSGQGRKGRLHGQGPPLERKKRPKRVSVWGPQNTQAYSLPRE